LSLGNFMHCCVKTCCITLQTSAQINICVWSSC
jgi:hypothetical protein